MGKTLALWELMERKGIDPKKVALVKRNQQKDPSKTRVKSTLAIANRVDADGTSAPQIEQVETDWSEQPDLLDQREIPDDSPLLPMVNSSGTIVSEKDFLTVVTARQLMPESNIRGMGAWTDKELLDGGRVGLAPEKIPWSRDVLLQPDPLHHSGKSISETHGLIFIPRDLSFLAIHELISRVCYFRPAWGSTQPWMQDAGDGEWVLVPKRLPRGWGGLSFRQQLAMIPPGYRVASPRVEFVRRLLLTASEPGKYYGAITNAGVSFDHEKCAHHTRRCEYCQASRIGRGDLSHQYLRISIGHRGPAGIPYSTINVLGHNVPPLALERIPGY